MIIRFWRGFNRVNSEGNGGLFGGLASVNCYLVGDLRESHELAGIMCVVLSIMFIYAMAY
jgi:hypothetical protein